MNNLALIEVGINDFGQEDAPSIIEQFLAWTVTQDKTAKEERGNVARCNCRQGGGFGVSREMVDCDDSVSSSCQRKWPIQINADTPKWPDRAR